MLVAPTVEAQQAQTVQITDVRLEKTANGLQVILETPTGQQLVPLIFPEGNNLVIDILDATLAFPIEDEFREINPAAGIREVSVTQVDESSIRVTITGATQAPAAQVIPSQDNLVLSISPEGTTAETEPDEEIEIIATGEGEDEDDYFVPDASTATRTDTPLRDIPQSIQVVPEQVIEDQQAIQLDEAVRNVSGVFQDNTFGGTAEGFVIRGFSTANGNILQDGFRFPASTTFRETANLERIEVLKGPASVLYGNVEPGGVINLVTKQPLPEPFYAAELQVGSFGFVRPSLDLSGPLTQERNLLYRLNLVYENADGFRDYDQGIERFFVAPILTWQIGDRTDLTLDFSYLSDERPFDRGIINDADLEIPDVPFDRIYGEPDDVNEVEQFNIGYNLEHRFNDDWKLRHAFRYISADIFNYRAEPLYDTDPEGNLSRNFRSNDSLSENYALQTNLVGKFATGSIDHTLLFGVDLFRDIFDQLQSRLPEGETPSINLFDPVYGVISRPELSELTEKFFNFKNTTEYLGIYLQDQVEIADNLKLLLGGRFDLVTQEFRDNADGTTTQQGDEAFTPRVGIVYQPIEPLSLYASYSQSFLPNTATTIDGSFLPPERGTQYEVGVRSELLNQQLTINLAAFNITKTNVATVDPDNLDFSVAAGEVKSQGIELDIAGEILPGWQIIASYAYTDARITEDNELEREGLRLAFSPYNAASLWTTYELQDGNLQGLGFGAGLFFVGARTDGFDPGVELDSYLRTDAAIFYRRNN